MTSSPTDVKILPPPAPPVAPLTPRQLQIFALLVEGKTRLQIAELLNLSPITVRDHIRYARARLGARTMYEAIARYVAMSL